MEATPGENPPARRPADPRAEARKHGRRGPAVATLPAEPRSAGQARRLLAHTLADHGRDPLVDVAALLVSELVTNAVLHAGTPVSVCVRCPPLGGVRVEVSDSSPAPPVVRHQGTLATTGRGLGLVAACADRWGVDRTDTGKTVWFELDRGHATD